MIGNGYFNLLNQYIERKNGDIRRSFYFQILENIIKVGNLNIFKYLLELNEEKNYFYLIRSTSSNENLNDILSWSTLYGRTEFILLLLEKYPMQQWNFKRALCNTAFCGDMELMKLFHYKIENSPSSIYDVNVFNSCAAHGRISMIPWLSNNRPQDLVHSDMFMIAIIHQQQEL
ncbi:hypothetical protein PPL_02770 [Heterostelium album PN500]|uniref:Ankyrin repeat protein n=1 Tax=Heterostelium pallidum (strain ATCC 26659 / Pp 5 / PN500) TaxID=670386 RepID=D3B305_HETP5|nr:hypothetical protein PPL_02770 [Heterostelium album PN500]EFA83703.1 hypothetical protein PPL_02770 [Heterostelium album PN500]|eukprot:XP_020435820.1 hypothetical protein PPL_02770 [Heterostelium album PN500]